MEGRYEPLINLAVGWIVPQLSFYEARFGIE